MATGYSPLEGLYKTVYANQVSKLVPDSAVFHKVFKLNKNYKSLGKEYKCPVQINRFAGVTTSNQTSSVALNASISREVPEATVTSSSIWLPAKISDQEISAAQTAHDNGDTRAFVNLTKDTMAQLVKDTTFYSELQYRYGCGSAAVDTAGAVDNLGEVESCTQVSGDQYDIVLTNGSWCSGIWSAATRARLDIRAVTTGGQRDSSYPQIDAVFPATRTLRVTGTDANLTNVVAGDHIFWGGPTATSYENEMVGLGRILTNTGSLFGIDAAEFDLWKSGQYTAGNAPLTFGLLQQATRRAAGQGYSGDMVALVSPDSWGDVQSDMQNLVQQPGGAQNKYSIGCGQITLRSEVGDLTVISDPLMKRGLAMVAPAKEVERVGSEEGTFDATGQGVKIQALENESAHQVRFYQNNGVFLKKPAFGSIITNIAPSVVPS